MVEAKWERGKIVLTPKSVVDRTLTQRRLPKSKSLVPQLNSSRRAARTDLLRAVIREGLALALAGIVIGIAAAPPALYLMRNLVFAVSPLDPLTYTAVALLFLTVTIAACAIPARRASLVDPIRAIGSE